MADTIAEATLDLGDVIARPYRDEDAQELLAAARESVDSVGRWLPWCNARYGERSARDWITYCRDTWVGGEQFAFGVFDATSRQFLGAVGINRRDREHNCAAIGYWIRQSARGRDIASRVARQVAQFGFERVALARIEIVAAVGNIASRRTVERTGARFEGIARHRLSIHNEMHDAAIYALLPADLNQ